VLGGIATRLHVSYEHLEDLQLALEGLLSNEAYAAGDEVTVELRVEGETVEVLVGPLDARRVEPDLAGSADASAGVGLGRLLATVAEGVEVERRETGEWVRLRKRIPETGLSAPA
jgi:anti-sigma regulatory factor (Ser/Thr protein kinase)